MSDEFPLTFDIALISMLEGEVVMDSEFRTPTRFNKSLQRFEYYRAVKWVPWAVGVRDRVESKWRIIYFKEEFPLDFAGALRFMNCGQHVTCSQTGLRYRLKDRFYSTPMDNPDLSTGWVVANIGADIQKSSWKVVE